MSRVTKLLKQLSLEELVGVSTVRNDPAESPLLFFRGHDMPDALIVIHSEDEAEEVEAYWTSIFGDCNVAQAQRRVSRLREVEDLWNLWNHEIGE
jgi:hypothetical protein